LTKKASLDQQTAKNGSAVFALLLLEARETNTEKKETNNLLSCQAAPQTRLSIKCGVANVLTNAISCTKYRVDRSRDAGFAEVISNVPMSK
jgi:hypothetical protein